MFLFKFLVVKHSVYHYVSERPEPLCFYMQEMLRLQCSRNTAFTLKEIYVSHNKSTYHNNNYYVLHVKCRQHVLLFIAIFSFANVLQRKKANVHVQI